MKEVEIFVVASVIAVGGAKLDGDFEIGQGGIGFAGKAIESGEGVMNVIGFGSEFAGSLKALARFVPAAEIHHGDASLVMIFRRLEILVGGGFHALFSDAEMRARAISEFPAGASDDLLEFLFGTLKFLLVEEGHGLFVDFHLRLDHRIDHFDAATLGGRGRYVAFFLRLSLGTGC